jgi:dolichyl-phosphate-mannose-protein mannosyltransferase
LGTRHRFAHLTWRDLLIGLVSIGVLLRVVGLFTGFVAADASVYAVMGESLLTSGEFIVPLGEWYSDNWAPAYSHHYSPAYPTFLAPFLAAAGLTSFAVRFAAFVSAILLLVVAYLTTRSLYGTDKALLVTAVVAVDPVLVASAAVGYSEGFLTLFFVLTMWAILKSLKDERYMLLAGLFAGIAYLTKGVLGWFFLIAGIAGLAWRFHYLRWRVFRQVHYLAAIAIFGGFVALWSLRNLVRFWDGSAVSLLTAWQSSAYFAGATNEALHSPGDLLFILAVRIPLYAGLFLFLGAWWLKELRGSLTLSDEHNSGLWLSVALVYLLAWLISGVLWIHERGPIFWLDQTRYVVMGNVVILWLVVKDASIQGRIFRRKYVAMVAVLLTVAVLVLVQPASGAAQGFRVLRERVGPGDVVAIDGYFRYEVVLNVGVGPRYIRYEPGVDADFIFTANLSRTFTGYVLLTTRTTGASGLGFLLPSEVAVWQRSPA